MNYCLLLSYNFNGLFTLIMLFPAIPVELQMCKTHANWMHCSIASLCTYEVVFYSKPSPWSLAFRLASLLVLDFDKHRRNLYFYHYYTIHYYRMLAHLIYDRKIAKKTQRLAVHLKHDHNKFSQFHLRNFVSK